MTEKPKGPFDNRRKDSRVNDTSGADSSRESREAQEERRPRREYGDRPNRVGGGFEGRPQNRHGANDRGERPGERHGGRPRTGDRHDAPFAGSRSEKTAGAADHLIELDRDIMKLLVKRAKLVSRIREGREHASGPSAVMAEKAVRRAWEAGATAFSKDPRFARQLFDLLQGLQVLSKSESRQDAYNLSPSAKPVAANITGTPSSLAARMHICLAAALGTPLSLEPLAPSDSVLSCIKTCAQAGAVLSYIPGASGMGKAMAKAGEPASTINKTIFFGDDIFSLYFFSLMSVKDPGVTRLSGAGAAKEADLTPLRHLLPLLGARFTHLVPRSTGLPASIESSGELPRGIAVPADFPFEGVCALLLAPLCWNATCIVKLEELPAAVATAALGEVDAVFRAAGASVEMHGPTIMYHPQKPGLPEQPELFLDPVTAAYQLAVPAFAGGTVTVKGLWPIHLPDTGAVEAVLSWAGLSLSFGEGGRDVTAVRAESGALPSGECAPYGSMGLAALEHSTIPPSLLPLTLALAAAMAARSAAEGKGKETCLPIDFLHEDDEAFPAAESMLAHLGMIYENAVLRPRRTPDDEKPGPWFCPDGYWGAAFALCSFIRPGLKLVNPAEVSAVQPLFWPFFNGLPTPKDPGAPEEKKDDAAPAKSRRRILTD